VPAATPRRKTNAPRSWRRASALYTRAWDMNLPLRRRERKALARMQRAELRLFGRTVS
jgi:hypothetical protein